MNRNAQTNKVTTASSQPPKTRRRRRRGNGQRNGALAEVPNQTRSGIRPNPADPRTMLSLDRLCHTKEGACDALKILHPNGEYDLEPCKIPDGVFGATTNFEHRDEYQILPPVTGSSADRSWSCLIIHLPFSTFRDLVIRWYSNISLSEQDLWYIVATLLRSSDVNLYPDFGALEDCTAIKIASPSVPGESITAAQAEAVELSYLLPSVGGLGVDTTGDPFQFRSIRRTALGYTTDLDASSLYNEGRVVSGQWSPNVTLGTVNTRDATSGNLTAESDVYLFELPAITEPTIVQSDLLRREAEAKYGSYMPIRLCAPEVSFTSSAENRAIASFAPDRGPTTSGFTKYTDPRNGDLWMRGWAVGVEFWKNLNPKSQLRMKVTEDVEVVPAPKSVYSLFATEGHPKDDAAMTIVRDFSRKQPHAYDADFNRLNKMLGNILRFVGNTLGSANIPILSSVARPLTSYLAGKIDPRPKYNQTMQPLD